MDEKLFLFNRRKSRVRGKIRSVSLPERPRLSVFRSNAHIYAQVIDDQEGKTLVAASTLDKDLRNKVKNSGNKDASVHVGKLIAERALKKGIKAVVFDRGGYLFHGRVMELANAAREAGLEF
ncbi:MAG: 50S ribosomal protein L18 [Alphaproteobacteria bacterium]|nr:50S ribosomal protein L18 [Alphaproteobacteria bacterium]OJV45058.1 MAG: 50S ribosomal protein L18 [Alphaproteobacteria bacterium 43-37]